MIDGMDEHMRSEYNNLVEMQQKSCAKFRDREMYGTKTSEGYEWITFKEFGDMVNQFRGGLASLGVGQGDRVAIIANNSVEWAVSAYATYGLGAQFVPLYESQALKNWHYIIHDSSAKVLIVSNDTIFGQTISLIDEIDTLKYVVNIMGSPSDDNSFKAMLRAGKQNPVNAISPAPDSPMGLIYTSGTTGNPKGVILSHKNIISNITGIHEVVDITENDRSLSFLPWAHSFGQTCELHGMIMVGASVGFAENITTILDNLQEVKPTMLISVPRIFERIYDRVNKQMLEKGGLARSLFNKGMEKANQKRKSGKLSGFSKMMLKISDKLVFTKVRDRFGGNLRFAVSGGSPLSVEIAEFIDNLNIVVYEGYGLSETSPIVTANCPGNQRLGSVGKVIPGVRVEIDRSVVGEASPDGEIVVYGPNVMKGYHNRPEDTKVALTPDGGLRTGDLGHFDSDGFLYITGRIKEQYQLAIGKSVSPALLEEKLKLSPYITQVMIYGENKMYNVALIVPDPETLKDFCNSEEITATGAELMQHPEVVELFKEELEFYSEDFQVHEKPRKFALVNDEWTIEAGLLTPTMKLKRRFVVDKYRDLIDSLYS